MKRIRPFAAAALLCAALSIPRAVGCSSASPGGAPSSGAVSAARCRGTLGMETAPLARAVRKKFGLAKDAKGALVVEVLPGGPAAAAGVRVNDIVERIDTKPIVNDCEFVDAGFTRACEPVRVVLRRERENAEITLVPVDQGPFLEKSCRAGVVSACFRQGWLLWGRNQGVDRERAMGIYESACKAGSAEACAYDGLQLMDVAARSTDALRVLERSCELKGAGGCANLGFLYATGKLVARDDKRATAYYVKSCELGDAQGCYNVGLMADDGRGVPRDMARAAGEYEEACELGSSTACTNLGFLYENGRAVKKDRARAVALYQRGCDGSSCQPSNLGGCVNVGRAYRDGIGVEKDEARAASIFREACDRAPNPRDIHADTNSARACSLLGGLYMAGDGIPKDDEKGRELSELGCGRGDAFGCFNAAVAHNKDPEKATHFYDLGCKAGDGESCFDLGLSYEKGNGVERDRARAGELFKKACGLGYEGACARKVR